jgi:predicted PurR-regulated permease PerM
MRNESLQHGFFLGLLLLVTLTFLGLIQNFLKPIFWAVVLATLFYPTFQWWEQQCNGRSALASVTTILTIVVIVVVPLLLVGLLVASEASTVYQRLASGRIDLPVTARELRQLVPAAADLLERFGVSLQDLQKQVSDAALGASQFLASGVVAFGQNALRGGALFFLSLYLLFFFFRDGAQLLDRIAWALPLSDVRERRLFWKFAEVSRATLKGTIVIGLVQGILGGLIFWILGIEGAVLWGVVMAILALLPAVGAAVVWVPAAALLFATGRALEGLLLLVFGAVIISLADNVLRPLLVGRDTKMPDYLVLLTTLGGITLFGLSGVVIGPIIGALFLTVWDMFGHDYAPDPEEPAAAPSPPPAPSADPGSGHAEQPAPEEGS